MSSLLSPFSTFGQKHSFFHVEVVVHELTNVPLVTGLFSCKWKVKGSSSLASLQHSAVSPNASRKGTESGLTKLRHTSSRDHLDDHAADAVRVKDCETGVHSNASTPDVASIVSKESSSTDAHKRPHKPAFLTHLMKKNKLAGRGDDDGDSSTTAASTDIDQSNPDKRSSRRESVASRTTTDSRLTSTSKKSDRDLTASHKAASEHQDHNDPLLFFTQEPKGETDAVLLSEHKVAWERAFQVGLRVPIGKPRNTSAGVNDDSSPISSLIPSPSVSAKSSVRDLRARAHRDPLAEHVPTAWGKLTRSELKLTIRQDMPPDAKSTVHLSHLGYVVLDLAQFAPSPHNTSASSTGGHHHHHHHHHHHQHQHHHHHHHHHGGDHPERASRSETRRFLLMESKTNATVKVTINVTFVGGSREYHVPPISSGLMVNGIGHIMDPTMLHKHGSESPRKGSGSDGGSPRKSGADDTSDVYDSKEATKSTPSIARLDPSSHSVRNVYGPPLKSAYAKKTWNSRVPRENLKTSAGPEAHRKRASRDAERLFASGKQQHDRAPDDVVDAIFRGLQVGGLRKEMTKQSSDPKAAKVKKVASTTQMPTVTPPRPKARPRTTSSASNISRLSERSFSLGIVAKCREKKASTGSGDNTSSKSGKAASISDFAIDGQTSQSKSRKSKDKHLKVPRPIAARTFTESPSASSEKLSLAGSAGMVRQNSVRWDIDTDEDDDDPTSRNRIRDATPTTEDPRSLRLDDAQRMPPPPSVVVEHPYVPVSAAGISTPSASAVDLSSIQGSDDVQNDLYRTTSMVGSVNSGKGAKRLSVPYQSGVEVPATPSTGTAVGLDRLRKTSKAIGKMAKNAVESARSSTRPAPTTATTTTNKPRQSKGNRGIAPSEAASKGWQGAGWNTIWRTPDPARNVDVQVEIDSGSSSSLPSPTKWSSPHRASVGDLRQ